MRVISGSARGKRLRAPRGRSVRPTADRVKESLFNVLGVEWSGCTVLDLFAGSGALGIEALSRGAEHAVFVEADPGCVLVLRENIRACTFAERARVIRANAVHFLAGNRSTTAYSTVFSDPPYSRGLAQKCLSLVSSGAWLGPQGRMVVEHSNQEALPEQCGRLLLWDKRKYGDTIVSIYELGQDE